MARMSRNIFTQSHDGQKDYRAWVCLEASVKTEGPFDRGGIVENDMREVDE